MQDNHFITSESVSCGHPDKVADQISDAILDAIIAKDPSARVACETLITKGLVVLAGELRTDALIDAEAIVRDCLKEIGYSDAASGIDVEHCAVINMLHKQSSDIAMGVDESEDKCLGAGDQGMMVGYAEAETEQYLPLPFALAGALMRELKEVRESQKLPYLLPDAKAQVTIEYSPNGKALRLDTVVLSTQHRSEVSQETLQKDIESFVRATIQKNAPHLIFDDKTKLLINPTGRFVIGGPTGDCGLTGRKLMVDTYGALARHGGGAFSGKDPSKVDRSAAYMCRYIAKNIVAAKLATRAEVALAYCIGKSEPIAVRIRTFGTSLVPEEKIESAITQLLNLTPKAIIEKLDLKRPIYQQTASFGHFGREDLDLPWERLDLTEKLQSRFSPEDLLSEQSSPSLAEMVTTS